MSMAFQCEKKKVPEMEGGNGCTPMWTDLMLLSYTPKSGDNGKFHIMYIYHK
jgi:hypothetical protein